MSTDPGEAVVEAARETQEAESREDDYWLFFGRKRGKGKRRTTVMRTALLDLPQWLVDGLQSGEIGLKLEKMREKYRGRLRR